MFNFFARATRTKVIASETWIGVLEQYLQIHKGCRMFRQKIREMSLLSRS
jgi:hypothetical protein